MKILYCTDTFFPQINGVTNTLRQLMQYLNSHEIDYLFFAPEYDNQVTELEVHRVKRFKSVVLPAYPECRISIPLYTNFRRLADKFNPDVVHLMTPVGIGYTGLKYAQERGLPVVSSFTTNFDIYLQYYMLDFLKDLLWNYFRWFHNACHINFSPSQDTTQSLLSKGIKNIQAFSRGIDIDQFAPYKKSLSLRESFNCEGKILFLYVGRLSPEKDLDLLMEAIQEINHSWFDRAHFVIAGDGPSATQLQAAAPENVTFTGFLKGEALSALYASCDVFVFPSSTETFGNVVLEAMASGLPVVAVNAGGVKENVLHGSNGFLSEAHEVQGFARSIKQFLENQDLISPMGHQARQYTLTKSWAAIFDQVMGHYQTLIQEQKDQHAIFHLA